MLKIFTCILFPVIVISQNIKLDEKDGFMQYKFGSSPGGYKNLLIELDESNSKLYSVTGNLVIDGIEYEYIRLTFTKNKLTTISLQTKNSNGQKLFQFLKTSFGEPKFMAKNKNYEWKGNKVQLIYTNLKEDGIMDFYSIKSSSK